MIDGLNLDPVFDMIAASKITEWAKEDVANALVKAGEVWLPKDAQNYHIEGVELYGEIPLRYKIDLIMRPKNGDLLTLVDWKTKLTGKLDERWEKRETRSRQRKLYAAALAELRGVDIFPIKYEVRGITLKEDKTQTKTLPFIIEAEEARRAMMELRGVAGMRDSLLNRPDGEPWVRDESGCELFGPAYKCEFEDVCWNGKRRPEGNYERVKAPMSHSKTKEFLRCPERYALIQITDRPDEDDEDSTAGPGNIFHRSQEMIYEQIRQLQERSAV